MMNESIIYPIKNNKSTTSEVFSLSTSTTSASQSEASEISRSDSSIIGIKFNNSCYINFLYYHL